MDSRPGDEMLLRAGAERDMGVFRALSERHAGRRGPVHDTSRRPLLAVCGNSREEEGTQHDRLS
jgi:hypothetical protein